MGDVESGTKKTNQEHYNLLKYYVYSGDIQRWNAWYRKYMETQSSQKQEIGAYLQGINLEKEDLKKIQLHYAHLEGSNLGEANLSNAELLGASMQEADLTFTILYKAGLNEVNLTNANMFYADLKEASLNNSTLDFACLDHANLQKSQLRAASLRETDLKDAELQNASLSNVHAEGADFSYAHLEGTVLSDVYLHGANFTHAIVDSTTLITGDPNKIVNDDTDFTGVGLSEARIDPKLRTRLERNIRKKQWEIWYQYPHFYNYFVMIMAFLQRLMMFKKDQNAEASQSESPMCEIEQIIEEGIEKCTIKIRVSPQGEYDDHKWLYKLDRMLKKITNVPVWIFWWLSDYGSKTTRILGAFIGLNLIFTALYLWVVPHLPTIRQGANPMFAELMYNTSTVDPVAALIQSNMIVFSITDVATSNLDYIPMFLILVHIVLGYVILAALVTRFAIMFQSLSP